MYKHTIMTVWNVYVDTFKVPILWEKGKHKGESYKQACRIKKLPELDEKCREMSGLVSPEIMQHIYIDGGT